MNENETMTNISNDLENNFEDKNSKIKEKKELQVVPGNGELFISPVYNHLEVEKPKPKEKRTIVIPEVKQETNKRQNEDNAQEENSANTEDLENNKDLESNGTNENSENKEAN